MDCDSLNGVTFRRDHMFIERRNVRNIYPLVRRDMKSLCHCDEKEFEGKFYLRGDNVIH